MIDGGCKGACDGAFVRVCSTSGVSGRKLGQQCSLNGGVSCGRYSRRGRWWVQVRASDSGIGVCLSTQAPTWGGTKHSLYQGMVPS
jgi:hypothetical protein